MILAWDGFEDASPVPFTRLLEVAPDGAERIVPELDPSEFDFEPYL